MNIVPSRLTNDEISGNASRRVSPSPIARSYGRFASAVCTLMEQTGGAKPRERTRATRSLSSTEREEILRGLAAGTSLCELARQLGPILTAFAADLFKPRSSRTGENWCRPIRARTHPSRG